MSVTRIQPPVPQMPEPAWYAESVDAVVAQLRTDVAVGLGSDVAASRLDTTGPNRLESKPPRPAWLQFVDQFRNVLVGLLVVGAVIAALIGDVKDSIAIGLVLVLNAALGYVQERRAASSLAALRELLALRVRVRRDGAVVEVAADDLVPGDVVLLEAGDRVPADGRVVEAWSAQVDESTLTGESTPVTKSARAVMAPGLALGDRVTSVFMNTQVTQGRLVVVVTETGMSTEIGKVAELVSDGGDDHTPLQRQLDRLGKRLAALSGSIVAAYFLLGVARGLEVGDVLISSVALIVAAIPEGLPAVVTLTLAVGTSRLARRGAIMRKLASVETLGSTSVICSDKTGTLTLNQMTCRALVIDGQRLEVTGEGYGTDGTVLAGDHLGPLLTRLGDAGVLCNDSHISDGQLIGDPTEGALVVVAAKLGIDADAVRSASPRITEVPFDADHKFMATFHPDADDSDVIVECTKGAWEIVADRCSSIATWAGDRTIQTADIDELSQRAAVLADEGLRVLAVATRTLPAGALPNGGGTTDGELLDLVDGLTLLGLVALLDPPRPEAIDAVAHCRRAGIAVTMITGDHARTARAIAGQLGIGGDVIEGHELDDIDDDALPAALANVGVVARVSPQHKVRVVQAIKRRGQVVAMTGDGVNDAPALVAADIGIAMGTTGTEVAKDAADMVLVDDNFATITGAVEQGRGIYDNIIKFVRFQVGTNIGALTTFIAAQLLAMPTPFNPIQILWINLIMDGPPAMALGVDPVAPGTMHRPPRPSEEQILPRHRMARVFLTGTIMAVGTLAVLAYLTPRSGEAVALTSAFTTFVFFQVANALNVRAEHDTIFGRATLRNGPMWAALTAVLVLQILAVTTSLGHQVFSSTSLRPGEWLITVVVASSIIWIEESYKLFSRIRAARGAGHHRPGVRDA